MPSGRRAPRSPAKASSCCLPAHPASVPIATTPNAGGTSPGWRASTRRRSAAFPASVSPESARAAPAAGVGTLKRFIRVYPCSIVANELRTRAALMVALGGVARQAAQRGDRFVVFEAAERALGGFRLFRGPCTDVIEVALRVVPGHRFRQGARVALLDALGQAPGRGSGRENAQ